MEAAFDRSGHRDHAFLVLPGADHELRLPDGSLASGYLEGMSRWVLKRAP